MDQFGSLTLQVSSKHQQGPSIVNCFSSLGSIRGQEHKCRRRAKDLISLLLQSNVQHRASSDISMHIHINDCIFNFKKARIDFTHCVTILLFIPHVLLNGALLLSSSRYLFQSAPLNLSILFNFGKASVNCTHAAVK